MQTCRNAEMQISAHFMAHAICLATRNLGQTWPNPAVGAVVVKHGAVVGVGWTARGGRPHAEPQAIAQAAAEARGATLYVTLEPCRNCADAIIASGISHVVYACRDPHPKAGGEGIAALQHAGVALTHGLLEDEALRVNEGFFSVLSRGRPFVTLKVATSCDGMIAERPGIRTQITCPEATAYTHLLRSRHDALLTGIGTVLADNPQMTCRLPGLLDRTPVRVVLDRHGRLPADCALLKTNEISPIWTYKTPLPEVLHDLAGRGITRVMVEAGHGINSAFLEAGLIDRLHWIRAKTTLGAQGLPAFRQFDLAQWQQKGLFSVGSDQLELYEPA